MPHYILFHRQIFCLLCFHVLKSRFLHAPPENPAMPDFCLVGVKIANLFRNYLCTFYDRCRYLFCCIRFLLTLIVHFRRVQNNNELSQVLTVMADALDDPEYYEIFFGVFCFLEGNSVQQSSHTVFVGLGILVFEPLCLQTCTVHKVGGLVYVDKLNTLLILLLESH